MSQLQNTHTQDKRERRDKRCRVHGDDRAVAAEAGVAAAVVDVRDANGAQRLCAHDARLARHKEVAAAQPGERAALHTRADRLELRVARCLCG